jgi:hypothetical protein
MRISRCLGFAGAAVAVLAGVATSCAAPGECLQITDCNSGLSCSDGKCVSTLSADAGDAEADDVEGGSSWASEASVQDGASAAAIDAAAVDGAMASSVDEASESGAASGDAVSSDGASETSADAATAEAQATDAADGG